nr:hypothetical protein [Rhodococcus opacus]
MKQLPDGREWLEFFAGLYDLYRQSGIGPALQKFREHTFAESDRQAMARAGNAQNERVVANATYWFEHELRQYPAVDLDLGTLATYADRIVPMAGRESHGHPAYEVSVALGRKLGREVVELPGGHIGCVTRPAEFAGLCGHSDSGHAPDDAVLDTPQVGNSAIRRLP